VSALVRLGDLSLAFEDGGQALVLRSASRGKGARVPPFAAAVLAFCSEPRTAAEVSATFGPQGAQLYEGLARAGFLVAPEEAEDTGVMFRNFAQIDVHRRMLADEPRVAGFAAAIAERVQPGMVVLDAGTGTGVLACLAARAGARRVYAVDNSDALELAREVVDRSGLDDQVELIRGDFARLTLPEKVDVIISETIGAFALAEGGGPDLLACAERNLNPGGAIIPSGVVLHLAPVGEPRHLGETVDPFGTRWGCDLTGLRATAMGRARTEIITTDDLAVPGVEVARLPWPHEGPAAGQATFTSDEPMVLHGFAGWFTLELSPGVSLSSAPGAPLTHWRQTYLPAPAQTVAPGEPLVVDVAVAYAPEDRRGLEVRLDWRVGDVARGGTFRVR